METTGATALSPGQLAATQISTHGEFDSPAAAVARSATSETHRPHATRPISRERIALLRSRVACCEQELTGRKVKKSSVLGVADAGCGCLVEGLSPVIRRRSQRAIDVEPVLAVDIACIEMQVVDTTPVDKPDATTGTVQREHWVGHGYVETFVHVNLRMINCQARQVILSRCERERSHFSSRRIFAMAWL